MYRLRKIFRRHKPKRIKMILIWSLSIFAVLVLLFLSIFFVGTTKARPDQVWGINFSSKAASGLGLDPKAVLKSLVGDLNARHFRLMAYWDLSDLDWQIKELENVGGKVVLALGLKTPRWPECHMPGWASNLPKEEQQKEILNYISAVVEKYKNSPVVEFWQVENEPFVYFGTCPWKDSDFLAKEVALVRKLDPQRQIISTDSGEWSFWFQVARYPDIVGHTLYTHVFSDPLGRYWSYPFKPISYRNKARIIGLVFGKEVWNMELQMEPWARVPVQDISEEESDITMSPEKFTGMIESAKRVGSPRVYTWGAEWWYWKKEVKKDHRFWEIARELFNK
jgi:hypothetical protein